jgi:KDO2-lipid IV(A) lauroyltransferase
MFVSKPIKINNKKTIIEITKFLNDLLERMILRKRRSVDLDSQ